MYHHKMQLEHKSLILLGSIMIMLVAVSCKDDDYVPRPLTVMDAIVGEHQGGVGYYWKKDVSSNIFETDTTDRAIIIITRQDADYVYAEGYGWNNLYPIYLPYNSTDTLFSGSSHTGDTYGTMTINLADRTISTHTDKYYPSWPVSYQWKGKWKF